MDEQTLFKEHVRSIIAQARAAMQECGYDQLVIHAGTPTFYAFDDQEVPFRALPHFKRFVPIESPHHLLILTATRSLVLEVVPVDYWEEQGGEDDFWKSEYEVLTMQDPASAWAHIKELAPSAAFVGDAASAAIAQQNGIAPDACNAEKLIASLDTSRAYKTAYEIACIDQANRAAAPAHVAARDAFVSGASELEIHQAFVAASGSVERDLSYETIIALNEKGATLHYFRKRTTVRDGRSFLIDAGVSYRGYASDVSRTYATASASPVFVSLVTRMDALQQKIVALVRPGVHFIELHHETHMAIAKLLKEHNVITTDSDNALEYGVTRAFLPHGLGHMLGLQVHDVGNTTTEGVHHPLHAVYPTLRTNLKLKEGMVTTIEPGLYFNEILLAPHRAGPTKELFNWSTIDQLMQYGGIRIEDNIVVTADGHTNLTRQHLP